MNTAIVTTSLLGIGGKQVSGFSGDTRKFCITTDNLQNLLDKLPKDFEFMSPTSSNEGKEVSVLLSPVGAWSLWVPDVAHKPKAVQTKPANKQHDEFEELLSSAGIDEVADSDQDDEDEEDESDTATPVKVEVKQPAVKTETKKVVQDTRAVAKSLQQKRVAQSAPKPATKPKAAPVAKEDPVLTNFEERVRNWMLANQDGGRVSDIAKPQLSLRFNKDNLHQVESRLNSFFNGRVYLSYAIAKVEGEYVIKIRLGEYRV